MKKLSEKLLALLLVFVMLIPTGAMMVTTSAVEESIKIGDKITLGSYNGSSITWICVDIDENGPLMLAEDVLCEKEYDDAGENTEYHSDGWNNTVRKNEGSNNWQDSNIRQWLNTSGMVEYTHCPPSYADESGFLSNFTANELACVKTVSHKVTLVKFDSNRENHCDGGSSDSITTNPIPETFEIVKNYHKTLDDMFMLLDVNQFKNIYYNNPEFLICSTRYFTACIGGNNYACFDNTSTVVPNSTNLDYYYTAKNIFGIRPAFYLNVDAWESAGDVSGEYYICGKKFNKNIDYYTDYNTSKCSSSDYNAELANMTAALSKAVYSADEIENAYLSLGFDKDQFGFYDYGGEFNPYRSGHTIGLKKSEYNDDIICLVVVRGTVVDSVSDWLGNISIATTADGKHTGFAYPADNVYSNINSLLEKNQVSGKIKYVITGHSRGAAVANLLAVKLMEKGVGASDIYNYNFACPDVACKIAFVAYSNIFNLCNREDPVPFVPGHLASTFTTPGTSWGKYGQTYWFTKDAEDTINPVADHDMGLYLEFFDQQKMPEDWGKSFWDKVDDSIYWTKGLITKIFCPVDVIVKDADGNKIASVIGGEVNYYDSSFGDVIILTDGDKKIIFVSGDNDFNVELIGTDDGTMTYSVEKCNLATEEISESKTFENVKLEKGKEMYSPVSNAETTEDVELFVVENKNSEYVTTHTISPDGTETEIYHIYETEVVKPTCTEKGYTNHVCLNCDDSYKDTYVDATGHTDADNNGICDVCAENVSEPVNPGIMMGDVDGNGKITAADARAALRISAKLDIVSAEKEKIADIDGNGKVTASDARKILRFSAKLDKVLGG